MLVEIVRSRRSQVVGNLLFSNVNKSIALWQGLPIYHSDPQMKHLKCISIHECAILFCLESLTNGEM